MDDKSLATQKTASTLVEAYIHGMKMVKEAYQQLEEAHHVLENAFGRQSYMDVTARRQYSDPMKAFEDVEEDLKRRAWKRILAISQINKMLSIKRAEEMSEKLKKGDLPDITLDEVLGVLHSVSENAGDFVREAAKEVFDVLRPAASGRWGSQYKTNQKNGKYNLGEKVILSGYLERQFGGGFRVSYWREKNLVAIDRVFHALDGNLKGMDTSYQGPLCDAIGSVDMSGKGETEYFIFKCFKNHNLHLKFKRMDLVTKLNAINGDANALKG